MLDTNVCSFPSPRFLNPVIILRRQSVSRLGRSHSTGGPHTRIPLNLVTVSCAYDFLFFAMHDARQETSFRNTPTFLTATNAHLKRKNSHKLLLHVSTLFMLTLGKFTSKFKAY